MGSTVAGEINIKTKEIVIDFRKRSGEHAPVYINGDEVEMIESFKFLDVQSTNNLSWSLHAEVGNSGRVTHILSLQSLPTIDKALRLLA